MATLEGADSSLSSSQLHAQGRCLTAPRTCGLRGALHQLRQVRICSPHPLCLRKGPLVPPTGWCGHGSQRSFGNTATLRVVPE